MVVVVVVEELSGGVGGGGELERDGGPDILVVGLKRAFIDSHILAPSPLSIMLLLSVLVLLDIVVV